MSSDHDSPITLPPNGASAEEMLRSVLPLVARSSAESAKAATLAATAINSNEATIDEVRDALREHTIAIEKLTTVIEGSVGKLATEKEERGKWMRRLVTPELFTQIVLNILVILAAMAGVSTMMEPSSSVSGNSIEAGQHEQP
jgi:hypothetical protein